MFAKQLSNSVYTLNIGLFIFNLLIQFRVINYWHYKKKQSTG